MQAFLYIVFKLRFNRILPQSLCDSSLLDGANIGIVLKFNNPSDLLTQATSLKTSVKGGFKRLIPRPPKASFEHKGGVARKGDGGIVLPCRIDFSLLWNILHKTTPSIRRFKWAKLKPILQAKRDNKSVNSRNVISFFMQF